MFGKFKRKQEPSTSPSEDTASAVTLIGPAPPSKSTKNQEFEKALQEASKAETKAKQLAVLGADTSGSRISKKSGTVNTNQRSDLKDRKQVIKRTAGGKTWEDPSLLEWDPSHFRLFVGNLSGEVTDGMMKNAFKQYSSLSKVKVIKDKKTDKAKGYAFVAFSNAQDYLKAFKEMNGKYVGNHPIHIKRANTDLGKKRR